MPRSIFQVSIFNIRAENLAPNGVVDRSIDSYLKLNFAGGYKLIQSETTSKTCHPVYQLGSSASFNFTTNFGHRLDAKSLDIECWQKNSILSDELIGTTSMDLHTIATGPTSQSLTFKNSRNVTVGTLHADVSMIEVCPEMKSRLLGCTATMQLSGDQGNLMSLSYYFSSTENVVISSNVVPPNNLKPLTSSTFEVPEVPCAGTLTDLENSALMVTVNLHTAGRLTKLGEARINLAKLYQVGQSATPFHEPVYNSAKAICGELSGLLQVSNGPTFAQMIGGTNLTNGTQPGSKRFASMPVPLRLLGPIPAAGQAVHAGSPSVSPRPPASPRPHENLPPVLAPAAKPASNSNLVLPSNAVKPVAIPVPQQLPVQVPVQVPISVQPATAALTVDPVPRAKTPFDDLVSMPRGWGFATNPQGMVYFKYHDTKQTSWQDPRLLPSGFEQRMDAQGRMYFAYAPTKSTTWTDPRGLPSGWTVGMLPGNPNLVYTEAAHNFTTHIDPRGLPPGYTQSIVDATGKVYFKVHATRTTQWDDPRARMTPAQLKEARTIERRAWDSAQMQEAIDQANAANPLADYEAQMHQRELDVSRAYERWLKDQEGVWAVQQKSFDQHIADKFKAAAAITAGINATVAADLKQWEDDYMAQFQAAKRAKEAELRAIAEANSAASGAITAAAVQAEVDAWRANFAAAKRAEIATKTAQVDSEKHKLEAEYEAFLVKLESANTPNAASAAVLPAVIGASPVAAQVASAPVPAVIAPVSPAKVEVESNLPPVIQPIAAPEIVQSSTPQQVFYAPIGTQQ